MSETLARLETQLETLLQEVKTLKQEADVLEKQNHHLRTLLYQQNDMGAGLENLLKLYRQGFHICPAHFAGARVREEDCIFCLGFLEEQRVRG